MHKLSEYRTPLMGVAILFIMLFHSGIVLKDETMFSIFRNGDIGVEMFAFLSAIGVFRSLERNSSVIQFYKRRFLRIVPTYFLVAFPLALFRHFRYGASWSYVLALSFGISTFRDDITYWFITYIVVCYLVSPFLFFLKRTIKTRFLLTLLSIIFSVLLYQILRGRIGNTDLWTLRFPAYVLGFDVADWVLREKKEVLRHSNVWVTVLSFLLIIGIVILIRTVTQFDSVYIKYLCYFFSLIPLLIALCSFFERVPILIRSLSFLGTITLELYLLHERICLPLVAKLGLNNWVLMFLGFMFAVASAWAISMGVNNVRKHLSTKA